MNASSSDGSYVSSSSEGDVTEDDEDLDLSRAGSARSSHAGAGDDRPEHSNPHAYDWYFRYARRVAGEFIGYEAEGPVEEGLFLEMLLDGETIDASTCAFRQGRFAEWMALEGVCELGEFPERWIAEAERRHTENTSLRELFLRFDKDGSCSIDRAEMQALMDALQFPTPLDDGEFRNIAGPDGEIDFQELREYLLRVAPNVVEEPMWYYKDEAGAIEGPCPQMCFEFWIDSGYFKPETKVRHEEFQNYLHLGDTNRFPDDWLRRAARGDDESAEARKRAKELARQSLVWVHQKFSASPVGGSRIRPFETSGAGKVGKVAGAGDSGSDDDFDDGGGSRFYAYTSRTFAMAEDMADDMRHHRQRSKTSKYGIFSDDEKARRAGVARLSAVLFDKLRFDLYNTLQEFADCFAHDARESEARARAEADASRSAAAATAGGGGATTEDNSSRQASAARDDQREQDAALARARERRAQRRRRESLAAGSSVTVDEAATAEAKRLRQQRRRRKKNLIRLMKLVDPNGYVALNSCHTFGRVCCTSQVAERIVSDGGVCAQVCAGIKHDILGHKDMLSREQQAADQAAAGQRVHDGGGEGKESSGGGGGGGDGETKNIGGKTEEEEEVEGREEKIEEEEEEDRPGIAFGVSTLHALPVLWEQVARLAGEKPGEQGGAAKDCILIIARLETVPPPFNVWIRAQRGVGDRSNKSGQLSDVPILEIKNPSAAEAMLEDEELERQMTPQWHKWMPCATKHVYHVFRQTAYTPYIHEHVNKSNTLREKK